MLKELRIALTRQPSVLIQDAIGVAAIGLTMVVALHFPTMF